MQTLKGKPQRPANSNGSHLTTYQGEIIRKSICNDIRVLLPIVRKIKTTSVCILRPAKSALALGMI